jgi:hypothetical protein
VRFGANLMSRFAHTAVGVVATSQGCFCPCFKAAGLAAGQTWAASVVCSSGSHSPLAVPQCTAQQPWNTPAGDQQLTGRGKNVGPTGPTLATLWTVASPAAAYPAACVVRADNIVIFATSDGTVTAVDGRSGTHIWCGPFACWHGSCECSCGSF